MPKLQRPSSQLEVVDGGSSAGARELAKAANIPDGPDPLPSNTRSKIVVRSLESRPSMDGNNDVVKIPRGIRLIAGN